MDKNTEKANGPHGNGSSTSVKLTKKDFETDQEIRWCPGCGDYAILKGFQSMFAELGIQKENIVIVSGIGCASRFPYYVESYGFHTIHGRAPAVATGLKVANPDLSVWVISGDGDALSIGGNHLIHSLRRNVGIKIVMFNNRIYGLTKGQYSPTSEQGKRTKSTPFGSLDHPFNPISVALGAEASFVARTVDVYQKHMIEILRAAADHKGSAFVEVYQNCNIFNDGAFDYMRHKQVREENQIELEHGKPILFGKDKSRGLRMNAGQVEVIQVSEVDPSEILVHDAHRQDPSLAFSLSRLQPPDFPTPVGIFRDFDRRVFDVDMKQQVTDVVKQKGPGDLKSLLYSGDTWEV